VRTADDLRAVPTRAARALALATACALAGLGLLAANAGAATPTPALKILGITAPTHLPPRQSEAQRVTVEAEGGTFTLTPALVQGKGTLDFAEGIVEVVEGSDTAFLYVTVAGTFEVGMPIRGEGIPAGTTILGITPAEEFLELELSNPGTEDIGGFYQAGTTEVTGVSATAGHFVAGQGVSGEGIAAGTTIEAVGPGTLTLSQFPEGGGTVTLTGTGTTVPLPFDAAEATVQSAVDNLPGSTPGLIKVTGGPGGDAAHPYFLTFGEALAERDVAEVRADGSGLTGPHAFIHTFTTVQGGNGTGEIVVLAANVGALPTSGLITATIGPLPAGIVTSGVAHGVEWKCPTSTAGQTTVTCTTNQPYRAMHSTSRPLDVPVEVGAGAAPEAMAPVEFSGGGSPRPSSYQVPIVVSNEPAKFGIAASWAGSFEADGSPSVQAGGHPFDSAAYVMLNNARVPDGEISPIGDSKDVVVDLPPGFVGNPLAGQRCPQSTLLEPEVGGSEVCNEKETVGNLDPYVGNFEESLPFEARLFNDLPPHGVAAEFTTRLAVPLQSVIANVNSEEDFGIRLTGPNNPNIDKILGVFTVFEGTPVHGDGQALLTNPTNCAESAQSSPLVRAQADSFQEVGVFRGVTLVNCQALEFKAQDPSTGQGQVGFSFVPTAEGAQVSSGSTPVGAEAHLHISNPGLTDPAGLATPELKRAVIKLPEGMSLNPSSANGLEGCSETQIGRIYPQPPATAFPMPTPIRFDEKQPTCPSGSKLGTAEIKTPLLDDPLVGEVFLADQEANPFGSLLAVYLVVNDPLTGVLIKLPGEVRADPQTGRLTTVFDDNPQLPFEDLILHFRGGGPRSEFATSEVCGNFPTEGEWTPWSAPESGAPAQTSSSFSVTSNCASSPGARPFGPSFHAGTTTTQAGGYNPLVIRVERGDGEQELTSLDFTLPKGLIGKLAGIPYCSDAAIAAAAGKAGKAEQANPSCPEASLLGTVDTAAGVGSEPFHAGGKLYLAGPYKGAPVSSVAIVPAVAGPLDLGNVVVRAPLYIDHETAALTAKSDPLPTILKGIPLKVRSIVINVDRPGFILNPTNCDPMTASASIGGGSGATASPTARFQVGGCAGLKFAPQLKIQLKGKTKRAGNPALTAILTQPAGQSNIGFVSVALPHSEFLEQGHIRTNCTRVQFTAEQCPKGSIYGHAEAISPLLDQPLTGPVYLRSSSHRLPDLVAVLKGPPSQPIEVDLDGRIDSFHGGIRTTFETVPDAPVSKFVLRLPAGKKSLIVNSTNICKGKHRATVEMTGQSGREHNFSPLVEPKCGKQKVGKKPKHRKKGGK
jgi:hypothetical protein